MCSRLSLVIQPRLRIAQLLCWLCGCWLSTHSLATVRTLTWQELLPVGYELAQPEPIHALADLASVLKQELDRATGSAFDQQEPNAPVVEALHQQLIRIPGYIVPLMVDENSRVMEFFLVPYLGACIHVPPPPSNQIIYVDAEQGIPMDELWQPYWMEGKLQVSAQQSDEVTAGYRLQLTQYQLYE